MLKTLIKLIRILKVGFITTIFMFASLNPGYALEVTLEWEPNQEPDMAGYHIYYKKGSSGPPYDVKIDVGKTTSYKVVGLSDTDVYYFAVTAYDTLDLESDYSNEVSAKGKGAGNKVNKSEPTGIYYDADGGGCFLDYISHDIAAYYK